jgi:tRNA pseudouridine(55) synthase
MAKKRGRVLDGVLLLDKPVGLSSNHALQRAKRAMDAQKAGHTGTLDPFATGLLVCCMGRATKISGAMLNADKSYLATIAFGRETDSGDLTGIVVNEAAADFEGVSQERLNTVLDSFVGTQLQIPPMISALKRDGKPLYEYARQGIVLAKLRFEVSSYWRRRQQARISTSTALRGPIFERSRRTLDVCWVVMHTCRLFAGLVWGPFCWMQRLSLKHCKRWKHPSPS